ncbi:MAG: hypothetical protein K6U12_11315, partial [Armatimonadetes bacterium]|nr:hypothetical protein [Armatimonadota bacterium]
TEELATVEVVYQSSKQWSGSQFETDGMGKATEGAGAEAVALSSSQTGTDGGKKGSRGRVRASREAKRKANEHRERKDRLKGFCITVGDKTAKFKLEPPDAFYNWLYITALRQERNKEKVDCLEKCIQGKKYVGFTDIFFKTQDKLGKRYNCQARALAQYISLQWYRHELLEELFPEAVSLEEILDSAEKRFEEYVRKVYLKLF